MAAVTDGGTAAAPAAGMPAAISRVTVERPGVEGAGGTAWLVPAAAALAVRPRLWATAVRQLGALAAPGWWRARPRLPLPAPGYLRFRMVTAYGDPDARPEADDVVSYLGWCRDEHRRLRSGERGRRNRPVASRTGR
jgi:hypothetical protein